uniref:Uncharacterized protein n=1 Tax=Mycena chlorophos TaxID=658473 RepID=A0ABQ0LSI4_MYCCL|nr:predicted protein [Mycena chlorophos]
MSRISNIRAPKDPVHTPPRLSSSTKHPSRPLQTSHESFSLPQTPPYHGHTSPPLAFDLAQRPLDERIPHSSLCWHTHVRTSPSRFVHYLAVVVPRARICGSAPFSAWGEEGG